MMARTLILYPAITLSFLLHITDNCDTGHLTITQDPVAGTEVDIGSHTITITATDRSNNQNTCTFTLNVSQKSSGSSGDTDGGSSGEGGSSGDTDGNLTISNGNKQAAYILLVCVLGVISLLL
jgi:hypothetical protein